MVVAMDSARKLVMESIPETEAATILQFFAGLRGTLSVTFEERTLVGISPIEGAAIPDTPVLHFGRARRVNEPVGDRNVRRRDIQVEWNEQDGDLTLHAFYHAISKDDLNSALRQARKSGKVVRTMTVVLSS